MFKNISKYSWFSFIPFVLAILPIVYMFATGIIPAVYLFGTLIGWIMISGLGIATGYHRIFCHKSHNLPKWKENIVLFFGALGGQGSSITWVAIHRGYHHRHSDTEKDFHSPVAHSAWHSFFGWTLSITENSNKISFKSAADLLRKPNHVWFHRHQLKIQWLVPVIVALFSWQLALAMFVLPTGISILQDNLVNVLAHRKALIGYRIWDTTDNSHNNILLGLLGWGQGWHHGHHYKPMSFNPGSAVSGNWWEIDTCVIFLPFLGKPRLEAR